MKKFLNAFNGLKIALKHKAVFIQFIFAILALLFAYLLNLNYYELIFFIIAIFMVLSLEIINTAIEYICNFVEPKYNLEIKKIKDLAASAVLLVAIMALLICIIILINKIGGLR